MSIISKKKTKEKMVEFCHRNDPTIGNIWWKQEIENKYTFVAEERKAKSIKPV